MEPILSEFLRRYSAHLLVVCALTSLFFTRLLPRAGRSSYGLVAQWL